MATLEELDDMILHKIVEYTNLKETRAQMVRHLQVARQNKDSAMHNVAKRAFQLVDSEIELVRKELYALDNDLANGAFTL